MTATTNTTMFIVTLVYLNDGKHIETFSEVCETKASAQFFIDNCTDFNADKDNVRVVASIAEVNVVNGIAINKHSFNTCKQIA
jgi:hypothetical protein